MSLKKVLSNKWFLLILGICILIALFVLPRVINVEVKINEENCADEIRITGVDMHGVVTSKYEDNRGLKFFKYFNGQDTLVSEWGLLTEGFYDNLKVGDTIRKDTGSLLFQVKGISKDTTQMIDWDCN